MVIEHEELSTLIPHKGKMFIIDRISSADWQNWKIESETRITENFMFFDKNAEGVPNYACFEMAAQTISALTGLYMRENNLPPEMGMILSVSNLHFDFDKIASGQVIKIAACRDAVVDRVYSFEVKFFLDGKESGCGKLTVMEQI